MFTQGGFSDCTASRHKVALMVESGGEAPISKPCHHWPPSEPRPPENRNIGIISTISCNFYNQVEAEVMLGRRKTSKNWWERKRKKGREIWDLLLIKYLNAFVLLALTDAVKSCAPLEWTKDAFKQASTDHCPHLMSHLKGFLGLISCARAWWFRWKGIAQFLMNICL